MVSTLGTIHGIIPTIMAGARLGDTVMDMVLDMLVGTTLGIHPSIIAVGTILGIMVVMDMAAMVLVDITVVDIITVSTTAIIQD